MLKIFDRNHNAIGHIAKYRDCKIESDVSTGDKTLSFTYLAKYHHLENEMYVQTEDDEYVIKEAPADSSGFPQIVAVLNLEGLQAKAWQTFSVTDTTIDEAARTALAGSGWTVGYCDVTKRRNAGMMHVNTLGVIQNLCKAFACEPVYDTKAKTVSFYQKRGEDKGVYFISGLNLKRLQKKSGSHEFYTRVIPVGENGLTIESVNDGKNYLENYQYSNKVITYIWKDESYTDPQALKEDAELWLEDHSKPEVSYQADVRNLAAQKPGYSVLSYGPGDTVKLIDQTTGTMEEQRIVKLVHYPDSPDKDTCEIANTVLTFEEMQEKVQEAAAIINYTVSGDGRYTGTISVSDILHFEDGLAGSTTIGGINSSITDIEGKLALTELTVGEIKANYLKADEADLKYATIGSLDAVDIRVHNIEGDYASFKSVVTDEFASHTALIDKIYNEELVTAKGWMLEGAIGDAQISSVNANKLMAGTIDTAIVTVAGTDGRLQISDNTIRISDDTRVRVQIGKDASDDYTLAVWDAGGKLIWDALGATENTIQRKIIRDRMVADDAAIQALKIDFQSFDTALTEQGVTISGTVVQVGSKSLNVALSEQTQTISSNYTELKDYTDSAKAAAISTAASDAATKANNALASAKSYADAGIAGIEIGGRNLLRYTKEITGHGEYVFYDGGATLGTDSEGFTVVTLPADGKQYYNLGLFFTDIPVGEIEGKQVTISAWVKSDGLAAFPTGFQISAGVYNSVNKRLRYLGLGNFSSRAYNTGDLEDGKWVKLICRAELPLVSSMTVNSTDSYVKYGIQFFVNSNNAQYPLQIKKVKCEYGNKATDWTPAPEDTESAIALTNATVATHTETLSTHETRITANENAISLKVSTQDFNSYKTTVTGQISTAKTEAISAAATDATTKADNALAAAKTDATAKADSALADAKAYTTAQITTVNSHLTAIDSSIDVLQDQISLKVGQTDIDTAVQGIQIGGRNLLLSSQDITHNMSNAAYNYTSPRLGWDNSPYGISLLAGGGQFTLSFDYEITGITTACSMVVSLKASSTNFTGIGHTVPLAAGNNSGHYEYTFTPTAEQMQYGTGWLISGLGAGKNQGAVITLTNAKLEKGSKATDWTPAPEDTDAAITAVDNRFASYSTTAQMQSAIDLAKDSITSAVSQTYATKSEVSTVSGKVTSLETWRTEASQKITKDGIIATVGDYYAYQSDLAGAVNRIAEVETKATQTADKFNWLVKSGTSATDFTLTDRTATLVASAINLRGLVTFSGLDSAAQGKINTAHTTADTAKTAADNAQAAASAANTTLDNWGYDSSRTYINGGKIYAGTVTAQQINVEDLFAQDITATGTIRGANLVGATGSFSGSVTATSGTIGLYELFDGGLQGSSEDGNVILSPLYIQLWTGNPNGTSRFYASSDGSVMAKSIQTYGAGTIKAGDNTSLWSGSEGGALDLVAAGGVKYAIRGYDANFRIAVQKTDGTWLTPFYITPDGVNTMTDLSVTGSIKLPSHAGMLIGGMTRGPIVAAAHTNTSYYPVIRQNTASGNVFNLGGISVSSTDERFGIYAYKAGRTENGVDYSVYLNAADGTLKHTGVGFSTSGGITAAGKIYTGDAIEVDGTVHLHNVYSYQSTETANVRIGSTGRLARASSSSVRYKDLVSVLSAEDTEPLYDIPVHWFKYKEGYIGAEDERYRKTIPGFIVEDWENILPIAIDHNPDGSPEMWNSSIVVPLMFQMIKNEHQRNTEVRDSLQGMHEYGDRIYTAESRISSAEGRIQSLQDQLGAARDEIHALYARLAEQDALIASLGAA